MVKKNGSSSCFLNSEFTNALKHKKYERDDDEPFENDGAHCEDEHND